MKIKFYPSSACLFAACLAVPAIPAASRTVEKAAEKTAVSDPHSKALLLGKHGLRLQWLGDNSLGAAVVTDKDGLLELAGREDCKVSEGPGMGDFLEIAGVVTKINPKSFVFKGKITSKVYFLNEGKPCTREGVFDFRITGQRHYWRILQKEHGCGDTSSVDYIDLLFR